MTLSGFDDKSQTPAETDVAQALGEAARAPLQVVLVAQAALEVQQAQALLTERKRSLPAEPETNLESLLAAALQPPHE